MAWGRSEGNTAGAWRIHLGGLEHDGPGVERVSLDDEGTHIALWVPAPGGERLSFTRPRICGVDWSISGSHVVTRSHKVAGPMSHSPNPRSISSLRVLLVVRTLVSPSVSDVRL